MTNGKGVLVLYKTSNIKREKVKITLMAKSFLKIGDMVYIPKHTLHWHGAIAKKDFSHIAFNSLTNSGKEARTIWYDSDYVSFAMMIK